MRSLLVTVGLLLFSLGAAAADSPKPPIYLWFEPEWFEGVTGSFNYWTGTAKPTGSWGVVGPGIAAEWSQGGESEWNSMGVAAAETKARCQRDFTVPRTGTYHLWVRYVDHRKKTEPFRVIVEQGGKQALQGELGVAPVLPPNDEYQLYWGFSFGWGKMTGPLAAGPARLILAIDKPGEAWRQLDAVLLTDDLKYEPIGREKPPFAFQAAMHLSPKDGSSWRGSGANIKPVWQRPKVGGKDFSMWTGVGADPKWWDKQAIDRLSRYDVYFHFSPPTDIREVFHKQFAGRKDLPIMSGPDLLPGFYLGDSPNLSAGTAPHAWLQRTKTPFFIMTNYASGNYDAKTGPGTYAALSGPLAEQFLGFIHGEAMGTGGVAPPEGALGDNRRKHVDALAKVLLKKQADAWSKIFKTPVPESFWSRGISCLSAESIALCHLFHDMGARVVGYEEDATNVHVPMRVAFERGAARQYGGAWINYASGNFGDSCNYFTQEPVVPRGAKSWFHSRYAVTDGVSISWYRKLYYMNYLSGASAVYWEQNLTNQWILPGPGQHPVQLSPFGRATEDFQAFVSRLPDRGDPVTPVAILLNHGHGYDRVNYRCKMFNAFTEGVNDLELRELFNVCWHPSVVLEGTPSSSDVQSMPGGVYGNIFDVLVDRPKQARAIFNYPVVWIAGDAELTGPWQAVLEEYLQKGGTAVVNIAHMRNVPSAVSSFKATGQTILAEEWAPDGEEMRLATPFAVADVKLPPGVKVLAWARANGKKLPLIVRHGVGDGAVILSLVPHFIGQDERAHPSLPYLMNGLTAGLLPVEVRLANGARPQGEIMYQINRTKDGYLVTLFNQRGLDKTQNGIARVDRRAFADVVLRAAAPIKSATEYTEPRELAVTDGREVRVRVPAGDVKVILLKNRRSD